MRAVLLACTVFGAVTVGLAIVDRGSEDAAALRTGDAAREGARLVALAEADLQRVRETGETFRYPRAARALSRAAQLIPRDPDVAVGLGTLALARHDFRGALRHAQRARRLAPLAVRPYAVLVDAQIELGLDREAGASLQRMIDLRPNLPSYSRVSYFRELHGDLKGAVEAMRLAISAGGGAAENVAFAQTLLGGLEFQRGRLGAARDAYRTALRSLPGYVPAEDGLADLDAALGRYGPSIERLQAIVARQPHPGYLTALGEVQMAAGRMAAARATFARVGAARRALAAHGVDSDAEDVLFEADYGDRRRAVALARSLWRRAPSAESADALGWSLARAGRAREAWPWTRRGVSLGTSNPDVLARAGLVARAAGKRPAARRLLGSALALNPRFSPQGAPQVQRALRSMSRSG